MRQRFLAAIGIVTVGIAVVALASTSVHGQTSKTTTAKTYTPPRTPDGHPDLSGIWSHNSATPFERPKELAGRATLTDEEVARMKQRYAQLFGNDAGDATFGDNVFVAALSDKKYVNGDGVGNYNHFWLVDREFDNRTSLIVDPPDGRLPPLTAAAVEKQNAAAEHRRLHPFDGPEDIALGERCITGTAPMLGAGYNNYYQIVQSPETVGLLLEMRHDARMIPIDNRPHVPENIHEWLGDPRGHWEGDTLVVDSTNFRTREGGFRGIGGENTRVTERFTRVAADTLKYEVTVNDLETYSKPWTAVLYWKSTKDPIYEYACHEGNEAMSGTLGGTRALEKAADDSAKKGSR
jgi:hypothetical protein